MGKLQADLRLGLVDATTGSDASLLHAGSLAPESDERSLYIAQATCNLTHEMARPRIFVSSTYYDLRHIRGSLELFITSLGYEPVLSERGGIPYIFSAPLDESCYREIRSCQIFMLIVGGRYGSETSQGRAERAGQPSPTFFDQYNSITHKECATAHENGIPTYILIEKSVYAEYRTYQLNPDNTGIRYAHADSVNVFRFIAELEQRVQNNPIFAFERYAEIENWLKDQWAGLFALLLSRKTTERQIEGLEMQVRRVAETNETLQKYLELTLGALKIDEAAKLISQETRRLAAAAARMEFSNLDLVRHITSVHSMGESCIFREYEKSQSFQEFLNLVSRHMEETSQSWCGRVRSGEDEDSTPFAHLRSRLGLPEWPSDNDKGANTPPTSN